jgi:hypothetical protein
VGLFGFLRKKDETAIPEPGTPEFDAAVQGSALPDSQSVSMGEEGWTSTQGGSTQGGAEEVPDAAHQALAGMGIDPANAQVQGSSKTIDLRGSGVREQIVKVLEAHGIDPDKQGQTIDASTVPGLQQAVFAILGQHGVQIPTAGGIGGAIAPPPQDEVDQLEHLSQQKDAGQITEAEFEAQKKHLLGE